MVFREGLMKGVVFLMASEKWGGLQQAEMTWAWVITLTDKTRHQPLITGEHGSPNEEILG